MLLGCCEDTANWSGSTRLGAALDAGTLRVMIGLPEAKTTTCWVCGLNQADVKPFQTVRPKSLERTIWTQLWPLSVLRQTPPALP